MPSDSSPKPVTIFYSYSHKDEKFRDELSSSLALMKRQGLIAEWYDGSLIPGDKWETTIFQQLDAADVILLLVSRDFINSDFIWGHELKRAMDRDAAGQVRVIPIIVRAADWQGSPIGTLQALPKHAKAVTLWSNRDAAWLDVAKGVRKAIDELQSGITTKSVRTVTPLAPLERGTTAIAPTPAPAPEEVRSAAVPATPAGPELRRTIYTADNTERLPGTIARREGDPATGDLAVDEAYDHLGLAYDFFASVFKRHSIDGKGMALEATVHYSRNYSNAFWNGSQIILGDGDDELFNRFTISPEIVAKQFANGVVANSTSLEYWQQSGALMDSLAIVLATMVKQYGRNQMVDQADWLIGEMLIGGKLKGRALYSLAAPGTAYDDPVLGKDSQPAHMNNYVRTTMDNGGIHMNSGIPNHAFFLTATALGGYSWDGAGKIWYETMLDHRLQPKALFKDFARLTYDNARRLNGPRSNEARAVQEAWTKVGIRLVRKSAGSGE